jgi:hypothetical protein
MRLTMGPNRQGNKEGGRAAAAPPGLAHANVRESGEEMGCSARAAQNKEGEGQERAGRRGAGL